MNAKWRSVAKAVFVVLGLCVELAVLLLARSKGFTTLGFVDLVLGLITIDASLITLWEKGAGL